MGLGFNILGLVLVAKPLFQLIICWFFLVLLLCFFLWLYCSISLHSSTSYFCFPGY